jgi:hypothetical protein
MSKVNKLIEELQDVEEAEWQTSVEHLLGLTIIKPPALKKMVDGVINFFKGDKERTIGYIDQAIKNLNKAKELVANHKEEEEYAP